MAAAGDIYVSPCTFSTCDHHPRSRIDVLAEPKWPYCENTSRLAWGTQQMIWTPSWAALTARPSARVLSLSKPKTDYSQYQCRCRPMVGGRLPLAKFGYPSERLLRLAEPKQYLPAYLEQRARVTSERPVSLAALNYNASQRILELARPKPLHPNFLPPRELPTEISKFATSAVASARIQQLAEPLIREMTCCTRHTHPGPHISTVSRSQNVIPSPRTIELSRPKQLHADYAHPRDPEWPVTEAAKHAVATPRLVELAQPSSRPRLGLTSAYNEDAFKVKEAALKAACSRRLHELAQPIMR